MIDSGILEIPFAFKIILEILGKDKWATKQG